MRRCLGASFAQLEMRIALRAILSRARGHLGAAGPRGHGPALDHAEPAARHADLGAPARARAARRRRRSAHALSATPSDHPRRSRRRSGPDTLKAPQGPQPCRSPVLPRGRGPAAIILRVRWALPRRSGARPERVRIRQQDGDHAAAAEARHDADTDADARSASRPPRVTSPSSAAGRTRCARGRMERAVGYFALPSVVSNGTVADQAHEPRRRALLQPHAAVRGEGPARGGHGQVRGRDLPPDRAPGPRALRRRRRRRGQHRVPDPRPPHRAVAQGASSRRPERRRPDVTGLCNVPLEIGDRRSPPGCVLDHSKYQGYSCGSASLLAPAAVISVQRYEPANAQPKNTRRGCAPAR